MPNITFIGDWQDNYRMFYELFYSSINRNDLNVRLVEHNNRHSIFVDGVSSIEDADPLFLMLAHAGLTEGIIPDEEAMRMIHGKGDFMSVKKELPSKLSNCEHSYLELDGVDLSGKLIKNSEFNWLSLSNSSLKGATLKNIVFYGCEFENVDFSNANLENVLFHCKEFKKCTFNDTAFENVRFWASDINDSKFNDSAFDSVSFWGASIDGVRVNNEVAFDSSFT